jgi:hypothetical protein
MSPASDCSLSILADGHVHIHSCFNLSLCLDAALANFFTINPQGSFFLFLTEARSERYFATLCQAAHGDCDDPIRLSLGNWTLQLTLEDSSLYAIHRSSQCRLCLISGQQIETSGGLEVLALMTPTSIQGEQPLETVIQAILNQGGIPVIPWGFGKWMGRRGKHLSQFLAQKELPLLFLGDNSGRPVFWSEPFLFKLAKARGLKILPGTDPLPFFSEFQRLGSFGFSLENVQRFDVQRPAASIKQALLNPAIEPKPYGSYEQPHRFIRNQLLMQLFKHTRNR